MSTSFIPYTGAYTGASSPGRVAAKSGAGQPPEILANHRPIHTRSHQKSKMASATQEDNLQVIQGLQPVATSFVLSNTLREVQNKGECPFKCLKLIFPHKKVKS